MSTYEDDIALLAADIRRWAGPDSRIHQALEQMLKLVQAEVDALAFEAHELEGLLVRSTTEREQNAIREASHVQHVRWGPHSDDLGW